MERLVASNRNFHLCADCPVGRGLGKQNLCKGMKNEIVYANRMVEGGPTITYADERNPDDQRARDLIVDHGSCEPTLQQTSQVDGSNQSSSDDLGDLVIE